MLAIIAMLIVGTVNAQKPKLAVMDFVAGVSLYQNDVNGLSDMLINSLFNTGRFELIERGQLCQLIGETNQWHKVGNTQCWHTRKNCRLPRRLW